MIKYKEKNIGDRVNLNLSRQTPLFWIWKVVDFFFMTLSVCFVSISLESLSGVFLAMAFSLLVVPLVRKKYGELFVLKLLFDHISLSLKGNIGIKKNESLRD